MENIKGAFVYESVFCFLSNLKIVKKVSLDYKNLRFENVFTYFTKTENEKTENEFINDQSLTYLGPVRL